MPRTLTKTNANNKISRPEIEEFRGQLLAWYDRHRRNLPWRAEKGERPDPYHVWLSEIMLQQTTVGAVQPYFIKFLEKWPEIQDLASADQEEVMKEWAGLGYYARARNLYKCAGIVANDLSGRFPQEQSELKKLPGIGDYTSAAIRTIAFNKPATVVDGNVERVMARYFAVTQPLPKAKPLLKELAGEFFEEFDQRPGDLAQALMDLGAGVCIAKKPRCSLCPISKNCKAFKSGIAEQLPKKEKKKVKPKRYGDVYWIENQGGDVLVHRREEKGLLGGMAALPTTEWSRDRDRQCTLPFILSSKNIGLSVYHSFTHFDLELKLHTAKIRTKALPDEYFWVNENDIKNSGFPTVFVKALRIFSEQSP